MKNVPDLAVKNINIKRQRNMMETQVGWFTKCYIQAPVTGLSSYPIILNSSIFSDCLSTAVFFVNLVGLSNTITFGNFVFR